MKKRILLICASCLLAIAYSFLLLAAGVHWGKQQARQIAREPVPKEAAYYMVREYQDAIAVFEGDSPVPARVLDIDVRLLRKQDRERFKTGIKVTTFTELAELVEDFSS